MSEDEAFIRAIVDSPGDDTPRLVYADWLQDRDDPRGAYVRAEVAWANRKCGGSRSKSFAEKLRAEKGLRRVGRGFDAVWVARVSRPPIGVCFRRKVFAFNGPAVTLADLQLHRPEIPFLPDAYAAFLLNYNGGLLANQWSGHRRWTFWECEGFARLGTGSPGHRYEETSETRILEPDDLPTVQGLGASLYHPNSSSTPWGWSGERIFVDCTAVGFARAEFGKFNYFLLRERHGSKSRTKQGALYYRDPLGFEREGMGEEEWDRFAARFDEEREAEVVAPGFTELLWQIDQHAPPN